jgi:uncharacterized cupredoxin-like copper-binding protein
MTFIRQHGFALATAFSITLAAGQVHAKATVIKVSLWDTGAMSMNMLGKGPLMGMAMGPMHKPPMRVAASTHTVPAGDVTFAVTNASKVMVHEMVVAPIKSEKSALPYDKAGQKVDEDAAGHLGEVAELEPGKKGSVTLNLKPGRYILFCNMPGHYVLGMWTLITVK